MAGLDTVHVLFVRGRPVRVSLCGSLRGVSELRQGQTVDPPGAKFGGLDAGVSINGGIPK